MNFAVASVKPKSKALNQDFYCDFATPRGHCFVVLDFAPHDYANLNATLQGRLETIVSSFVSLPSFSAELFLGFIAKEINNFIHHLAEQAGGPELLFSAALVYLNNEQLSYFLRGTTQIAVTNAGGVHSWLVAGSGERDERLAPVLGGSEIEPPTEEIHTLSLAETDLVLMMTHSVAQAIQRDNTIDWAALSGCDSLSIRDSLLRDSSSATEDQTLIVITGPFQRPLETAASQKLAAEFGELKEELKSKAGTIALLELGGKIDSLVAAVAGKAEQADLLELKRDVLKFGLTNQSPEEKVESSVPKELHALLPSSSSVLLKAGFLALIISLAAGVLSGWFFSRRNRPAPEMWSVRTVANQLSITRQNGGTVTLDLNRPAKVTGEQTFSSFADVQRYVDTIRGDESLLSQLNQPALAETPAPAAITSVIVKPGDSLKRFALTYNVPEEKIKALNPTIIRWPSIRAGQKVLIPAPALPVPSSAGNSPAQ